MRWGILICLIISLSFAKAQHKELNYQKFDETIFSSNKGKFVVLDLVANWCHWCHVMEQNTYSDPTVLSYLNEHFVVSKEDHDQRADLANRYRDYGWPATIIFNDQGEEIVKRAGYMSPENFLSLLKAIVSDPSPEENREKIKPARSSGNIKIAQNLLKTQVSNRFDFNDGGFNQAQKYIDWDSFVYALANYKQEAALKGWLDKSITGSYDILDKEWGGVFQYSTHYDWKHAHYEKLLENQARYISMYTMYAYAFSDDVALKKSLEIAEYVTNFLRDEESGLYFNSQNADLVSGEKATTYYELSSQERFQLGVPSVDSTIYTMENAMLAVSFIDLYAIFGDRQYLERAVYIHDYLSLNRKDEEHLVNRGVNQDNIYHLGDQLAYLDLCLDLFNFTQNEDFKKEAISLGKAIQLNFYKEDSYLQSYVGKSPLEPLPVIAENIKACQLLFELAALSEEALLLTTAKNVLNWLTSADLLSRTIVEPGILTAISLEEKATYHAVFLIVKEVDPDLSAMKQQLHLFQNANIVVESYTLQEIRSMADFKFGIPEENTLFFCTDSYCSSPIKDMKSFYQFLNSLP